MAGHSLGEYSALVAAGAISPADAARELLVQAAMNLKGDQTRAAIVEAALEAASREGLEGLTIGTLADWMHMSKSGLFAHFGSREELQISVIREYHARFEEEVFFPAIVEPRGLPRVQRLGHRAEHDLQAGGLRVVDYRRGARRVMRCEDEDIDALRQERFDSKAQSSWDGRVQ